MATLPIAAIVLPVASATLGPWSVPNWSTLDFSCSLPAPTARLWLELDHSPDGGTTWTPFAQVDFDPGLVQTGTLHVTFPTAVPGATPMLRALLSSASTFTLGVGSVVVT